MGNQTKVIGGVAAVAATAAAVFFSVPTPTVPTLVFGNTNAPYALEWYQANPTTNPVKVNIQASYSMSPVYYSWVSFEAKVTNAAWIRWGGVWPNIKHEFYRVEVSY